LAAAWVLPFAGPSGSTLRLGVNIAIFATLALGLQVIWGLCGQPSFGHAALFGVGAYAVAILTVSHGFGAWAALLAAAVFGTVAGVLFGLPALRVRADQLALVTFAVAEALRIVEANASVTGGSGGIAGVAPLTLGGDALVTPGDLYRPALVLVAVAYVLARWLRGSAAGQAMLAVRHDELMARTVGVHPGALKLFAFAFGGLLAGLAGGFAASFNGFVSSVSFGILTSFQLVVMVVLGGLGSLGGAVFGAAVVMLADDRLQSRPDIRLGVTGAAMILVVLARAGALRSAAVTVRTTLRRLMPS
jgi:branched-chain amino acid transport system permease protein